MIVPTTQISMKVSEDNKKETPKFSEKNCIYYYHHLQNWKKMFQSPILDEKTETLKAKDLLHFRGLQAIPGHF